MDEPKPQFQLPPSPPKAMDALLKGFNAIASNVAVILFPVALDVFFWLGPRLKADVLLAPIMKNLPEVLSQVPADQAKVLSQGMTDFYNGVNLFSVFRTFPMGVFSMMSLNFSLKSPLGDRAALSLPGTAGTPGVIGVLVTLLFLLALIFFGWVAGSLYFRSVARAAIKPNEGSGIFRSIVHGVLLSAFWLVIFMVAYLPVVIVLGLISLLNDLLRTILLLMLAIPISWVVLSIFFSFHGIFIKGQNAFESALRSFQMLRFGMPPLGWFAILAIIINQGMDLLWRAAPAESWMMGVGILGHAFISTSLLAASFIYYQDLNTWIESAQQWLKKQNTSSARA